MLKFPKGRTIRQDRRAKKRAEQIQKQIVRQAVAERDRRCRYDGEDPCEGRLEWAHLVRRSATRGMAPDVRHTTATTCMLCRRHHRRLDAHDLQVRWGAAGADGPLTWED